MNKFNFKITIKEEEFKDYLSNPQTITPALNHLISSGIVDQNKDIDIHLNFSSDDTTTNLAKLVLCLNDKTILTQVEQILGRKIGQLELLDHYKKQKDKNGQDDFIELKNLLSFSDDYGLLLNKFTENEKLNNQISTHLGQIFLEKIKEHLSELPTAMLRIQMNGYSRNLLDFCRIHINHAIIPEVLNVLKSLPDFNELLSDFKEMENIYHAQFARLYEIKLVTVDDVKEDELIYIMRSNRDLFQLLMKDGLDLNKFNINEILSHASDISIASLLVHSAQEPVVDEKTALSNLTPTKIDFETFKYYCDNLYKDLLNNKKFIDRLVQELVEKSNYHETAKEVAWDKIIFLKDNFNANIKNKNILSLFEMDESKATEEDLKKKRFCYEEKVWLNSNKYFTTTVSQREVKNLNHLHKKYPGWLGGREAFYILSEAPTVQLLDFVCNKLTKELFEEVSGYIKPFFGFKRKQDLRAVRQAYKAQFSQDIDINEKTTSGNTLINHFLNHYSDKGKYEDRLSVHNVLALSKTEVIDASAVNQYGNNPLFGIYSNQRLNFDHSKKDKDGNEIKLITKEELIQKMINVDLNHQNKDGNTLFHHLAKNVSSSYSYNMQEAMKALLHNHPFDASLKNNEGKTVIDLLSETNTSQHLIIDFEKKLLENGVNQEVKSQSSKKIKI